MAASYARIGTLTNGRTATAAWEYAVWWILFKRLVALKYGGAGLEIIQALGYGTLSGGTHGPPGACLDLRTWRFSHAKVIGIVTLAREAGAIAFYRTRAQGFDPHIHWILNIGRWSPGLYQIIAAKSRRRNGLGRGGMSGPDTHPAPSQWRTWKQGIVWMQGQIAALQGGTVSPLLPSTGAAGQTSTTTTAPEEELTVAQIDAIMAELKKINARLIYVEAQNKSIGDLIVDAPKKVWGFPIHRTVGGKPKPVATVQELANLTTMVNALARRVK